MRNVGGADACGIVPAVLADGAVVGGSAEETAVDPSAVGGSESRIVTHALEV